MSLNLYVSSLYTEIAFASFLKYESPLARYCYKRSRG